MSKRSAIFILTHGRANNVITYKALRKSGYTGDIYIIVDDEDKQVSLYRENYGDKVIVFSKSEIAKKIDVGDNFNNKAAVIYARNAAFEIAEKLGLDYYFQFDDDYSSFHYRLYKYGTPKQIKNMNKVLEYLIEFSEKSKAHDLAMAQGGDFIGGKENKYAKEPTLTRKCMNTHLLTSKRPFKFLGKINEDVNTPVFLGSIGFRFFTVPMLSAEQKQTQQNKGGLTDIYLEQGTYVKSFYSVMYHPSSCKVSMMGDDHYRLHHKVNWNLAVPKILDESLKKPLHC